MSEKEPPVQFCVYALGGRGMRLLRPIESVVQLRWYQDCTPGLDPVNKWGVLEVTFWKEPQSPESERYSHLFAFVNFTNINDPKYSPPYLVVKPTTPDEFPFELKIRLRCIGKKKTSDMDIHGKTVKPVTYVFVPEPYFIANNPSSIKAIQLGDEPYDPYELVTNILKMDKGFQFFNEKSVIYETPTYKYFPRKKPERIEPPQPVIIPKPQKEEPKKASVTEPIYEPPKRIDKVVTVAVTVPPPPPPLPTNRSEEKKKEEPKKTTQQQNLLDQVNNTIKTLQKLFQAAFSALTNLLNKIASIISSIFQFIAGLINKLCSMIANAFRSVFDFIARQIRKLGNYFKSVDGFLSKLRQLASNIASLIGTLVGGVASVLGGIANVIGSVIGGIAGVMGSIASCVTGIAGAIISGIQSIVSAVFDVLNIPKQIFNQLLSLKNSFFGSFGLLDRLRNLMWNPLNLSINKWTFPRGYLLGLPRFSWRNQLVSIFPIFTEKYGQRNDKQQRSNQGELLKKEGANPLNPTIPPNVTITSPTEDVKNKVVGDQPLDLIFGDKKDVVDNKIWDIILRELEPVEDPSVFRNEIRTVVEDAVRHTWSGFVPAMNQVLEYVKQFLVDVFEETRGPAVENNDLEYIEQLDNFINDVRSISLPDEWQYYMDVNNDDSLFQNIIEEVTDVLSYYAALMRNASCCARYSYLLLNIEDIEIQLLGRGEQFTSATIDPFSVKLLVEVDKTESTVFRETVSKDPTLGKLRTISIPPASAIGGLSKLLHDLCPCPVTNTSSVIYLPQDNTGMFTSVYRYRIYPGYIKHYDWVIHLDPGVKGKPSYQRYDFGDKDIVLSGRHYVLERHVFQGHRYYRSGSVVVRGQSGEIQVGTDVFNTLVWTAKDHYFTFRAARCICPSDPIQIHKADLVRGHGFNGLYYGNYFGYEANDFIFNGKSSYRLTLRVSGSDLFMLLWPGDIVLLENFNPGDKSLAEPRRQFALVKSKLLTLRRDQAGDFGIETIFELIYFADNGSYDPTQCVENLRNVYERVMFTKKRIVLEPYQKKKAI